MKKNWILSAWALLLCAQLAGQDGYAFGIKGGPVLATQNWSNLQRQPAVGPHAILFIESLSDVNDMALFAQVGYHVRGSALQRRNFFDISGNVFTLNAQKFRFNNLALTIGAKQKFNIGSSSNSWYYLFGLRGEYNISTNLAEFTEFNLRNPSFAIYPYDDPNFIRRITYGITGGAGLEFPFSEYVGGLLEFTINPDFSSQYAQPAIPNVRDPYTGNSSTVAERKIRNISMEITLGLRLLRLIEYID